MRSWASICASSDAPGRRGGSLQPPPFFAAPYRPPGPPLVIVRFHTRTRALVNNTTAAAVAAGGSSGGTPCKVSPSISGLGFCVPDRPGSREASEGPDPSKEPPRRRGDRLMASRPAIWRPALLGDQRRLEAAREANRNQRDEENEQ
ncbi:hypothetical protein MRX96_056125 [Rhipicephalus microplus]